VQGPSKAVEDEPGEQKLQEEEKGVTRKEVGDGPWGDGTK